MKDEVFTTCRDSALKFESAGVPVRLEKDARGNTQYWYPAWASRFMQLSGAAGLPKTKRREVLAALAADIDRRAKFIQMAERGDLAGLKELFGGLT